MTLSSINPMTQAGPMSVRSLKFLRALSDLPLDASEKRKCEVWRLACLTADPERQSEATEFCQSLIDSNPANDMALTWALSLSVPFDYAKSINALKKKLEDGKITVNGTTALISWLLQDNRPKRQHYPW